MTLTMGAGKPSQAVVGCTVSPPKDMTEGPNPVTMTLSGNRVFADVTSEEGLCWSRVGLTQ